MEWFKLSATGKAGGGDGKRGTRIRKTLFNDNFSLQLEVLLTQQNKLSCPWRF
jgi:hypothetical protein